MTSRVESAPSMTLPKIVYLPSKWGCLLYVTKNWDLFVSGPELAMATIPRALNWEARRKRRGREKEDGQIDCKRATGKGS